MPLGIFNLIARDVRKLIFLSCTLRNCVHYHFPLRLLVILSHKTMMSSFSIQMVKWGLGSK